MARSMSETQLQGIVQGKEIGVGHEAHMRKSLLGTPASWLFSRRINDVAN